MKKKVLFVEDESQIREIILARLNAMDFEVVVAKDGLEGLRLVRTKRPEMVLLDLILPKLDGYKLCRMIKFDTTLEHIPVIICSALGSDEDKKLAEQAGADAYMIKPFDMDLFVSLVQKLTGA